MKKVSFLKQVVSLKNMDERLSRKSLLQLLAAITLIYISIQTIICLNSEKELSRYFWLEHKNLNELVIQGKPEVSKLTPIMEVISDHHFWILRVLLISSIIGIFYYKETERNRSILNRKISISAVLILILVSGILTWMLKLSIGKPRPYTNLVQYKHFSLSTRYHSFPSGHTTETFAYIIPYIYYYKKWYLSTILLIFAFLVSFIRVILAYHYISDVIFGIYITIFLGYIICFFIDKKTERDKL